MPRSRAFRDVDLLVKVDAGELSEGEARAITLQRNIKEDKDIIYLVSAILVTCFALGVEIGLNILYQSLVLSSLLVYIVYSNIKKTAETLTDITYLQAGLKLTRIK